ISVPVNLHQKQGRREAFGRFPKGVSGNPQGRPPGSRNRATELAEALLDGEAEALIRKLLDLALAGDPAALKLCLERIVPRRERTLRFAAPKIESAADIAAACGAITAAAAEGAIGPADAAELMRMIDIAMRAIAAGDFDRRLRLLEETRAART